MGAIALLERAVALGKINLAEDDPDVLRTALQLGQSLQRDDDPMAARRVLEDAYGAGLWRLGDSDALMLEISHEIGVVAEELGNKHEARKAFGRVAELGPATLGAGHPAVARARAYLGQDQDASVRVEEPAPTSVPPVQQTSAPPTYQPPPQPTYEAPPQPTYEAPQPTYEAPPQPTYEAPPQPTYQAPAPTYQSSAPPAYRPSDRSVEEEPTTAFAPVEEPTTTLPPVTPDLVEPPTPAVQQVWQAPPQPQAYPQQPAYPQPPTRPGPPQQVQHQPQVQHQAQVQPPQHLPQVQHQPQVQAQPAYPQPQPHQPQSWHEQAPTWGPPTPPPFAQQAPAQPYEQKAKRGMGIFAAIAAVLAAVIAVSALVFVLANRSGDKDDPDVPTLGGKPPTNVTLEDAGSRIKVTWKDPANGSVSFLVAMAQPGQQLKPVGTLGPGQTSYEMNALNASLNYCFAVVAVYRNNKFATSQQACTDRPTATK